MRHFVCAAFATLLVQCGGQVGSDVSARKEEEAGNESATDRQEQEASGATTDRQEEKTGNGSTGDDVSTTSAPNEGQSTHTETGEEPTPETEASSAVSLDEGDRDRVAQAFPDSAPVIWGSDATGWYAGEWVAGTQPARLVPISPPRGESTSSRYLRTEEASPPVLWLQLDHPLTRSVNLRPFSGFSFWARSAGDVDSVVVALNIDGLGVVGSDSSQGRVSVPVTVGPEWMAVHLDFEEFGFAPSDAVEVAMIEFWIDGEAIDGELWIDDLTLLAEP